MIDTLTGVRARMEAADEVWWAAVQKFDKAKGEEPAVLKKRRMSDWSAGLPVDDGESSYFRVDDLPACREALARNDKLFVDTKGIFNATSRNRCAEVVTALEERDAYLNALQSSLGVEAANVKLEAIIAEEEAAIAAVQTCRAKTVEGLKRKAELAGTWEFGDQLSSYETGWARALLADIKAISGA
ncbi:MAG: hypothetical protein DI526_03405 [Caulobacter segnis]|uniref:Uncharacterized protein n=1 Tax=Caulobacter segnis TaxID=88688 RepID=A0A2W5VIH2_9CAUL|nr:MAG: hypothetical protein DI526_03405 [Caulobacter segnis]